MTRRSKLLRKLTVPRKRVGTAALLWVSLGPNVGQWAKIPVRIESMDPGEPGESDENYAERCIRRLLSHAGDPP